MKKLFTVLTLLTFISCKDNSGGTFDNSMSQQNHKVERDDNFKFRLLRYGLPPDPRFESALDVISEKWGIEYYWIAGCTVSNELADSVEKCNIEVEKHIQEKFGRDWEIKFKNEIDSLMKTR